MPYPLRFTPHYFTKIWGGRKIETLLGRELLAQDPVGESWELSDHPHGRSIICNGVDAGKSLHELLQRDGEKLIGRNLKAAEEAEFPLLVKYIDANDKLSVQVHPDDEYARQHEGEPGKTEMWYVLQADPGSCLIAGIREGVTAEQFRAALADGDPAALLNHLPVKTGDSIFIPSGRIHAIMPGLLILEIQQSSDTTYRLYDWNRAGLDGQLRELHIEPAMAVSNWQDITPTTINMSCKEYTGYCKLTLAKCQYFQVDKYQLKDSLSFNYDGASFHIINIIRGSGIIQWDGGTEKLHFADTLLIPADLTSFTLIPDDTMEIILSFVPNG